MKKKQTLNASTNINLLQIGGLGFGGVGGGGDGCVGLVNAKSFLIEQTVLTTYNQCRIVVPRVWWEKKKVLDSM